MPVKRFTFYSLGRDLDNIAPGFGVTVDYDILEGLIKSMHSPYPPAHLREELKQLAKEHGCEFRDWEEKRFVQFVRRGN